MSIRKYLKFDPGEETGETLLQWWKGLEGNRGERATLRRCRNLTEVAFVPSFHRLYRDLSKCAVVDAERLALVAGLAAHVRSIDPGAEIAVQMGQGKPGSGSAVVSGLRFRRLLKIQDREELFLAMIRIIALLGGGLNLLSLVKGAYEWNEWTRKKWAFDYYSTAPSEV
ncbi:MAG: type I-E CRISPR-associated protein Cse2/CasB [Deltaproteobacteria bacterium]|nr:type I-E CRISPR-associated protein Cse2/CasB [Deltaproteobacteria bacterium]